MRLFGSNSIKVAATEANLDRLRRNKNQQRGSLLARLPSFEAKISVQELTVTQRNISVSETKLVGSD